MHYSRKSIWLPNIFNGWSFDWESTFYKKEEDVWIEIGKDKSTVRAFTINEIELLLKVNNFKVREFLAKESYAFPTYVVLAEKDK